MTEHINGGALNEEQRDGHTEPVLGLAVDKELFLWGEELHVKHAPSHLAYLLGVTGILIAPESFRADDIVAEFWHGAEGYLLSRDKLRDWVFERADPVQALERAAEHADRASSPWHYCVEAPSHHSDCLGKRFRKHHDGAGLGSWLSEERLGDLLMKVSVTADDWVFSEHPPEQGTLASRKLDDAEPPALRRAREIYDHDAFVADLDAAVREIRDLLVQKNQAYGNSALDPVRIFSKADPMEQLFVRIDDKLSRLKRGHAAGEDVVKDLQGYLLLVRVAQMRAERSK